MAEAPRDLPERGPGIPAMSAHRTGAYNPEMDSLLVAWEPSADVSPGQRTFRVVRDALLASLALARRDVRVYMQGAHADDTLIRVDDPVDIVVEGGGASYLYGFASEVSAAARAQVEAANAAGSWDYWQFNGEVKEALRASFPGAVRDGDRSLRVMHTSLSVMMAQAPAEVTIALPYRHYGGADAWTPGVTFFTRKFDQVVQFPRLHLERGAAKDRETGGHYHATVRVAKQLRDYLCDVMALQRGVAPSYYLECLLWNVPNERYTDPSAAARLHEVIRYLGGAYLPTFEQQHGVDVLFGDPATHWSEDHARAFIDAAGNWLG